MIHAGIPPERLQDEAKREFQATRRDLARVLQALGFGDVSHGARLVQGMGAVASAGRVALPRPDLLALGTRGLSGVRRLVLGSETQERLDSLDADMLAVPPKA
jgi:nucleotide-binding universal stress UspA family protein